MDWSKEKPRRNKIRFGALTTNQPKNYFYDLILLLPEELLPLEAELLVFGDETLFTALDTELLEATLGAFEDLLDPDLMEALRSVTRVPLFSDFT